MIEDHPDPTTVEDLLNPTIVEDLLDPTILEDLDPSTIDRKNVIINSRFINITYYK